MLDFAKKKKWVLGIFQRLVKSFQFFIYENSKFWLFGVVVDKKETLLDDKI